MTRRGRWLPLLVAAGMVVFARGTKASERVVLKNGFDLVCDHREVVDGRLRVYLSEGSSSFVEFAPAEIASIEAAPVRSNAPKPSTAAQASAAAAAPAAKPSLTPAELREMLATAGAQHDLDVDLLASLVHAESGGNVRAVSRTGARGLMQLMPGTAAELGVADSFRPDENIRGGAAYLDALLGMYGDNLALALAAYNAGPGAVARWHGIPPYRETRAYVARVIREFNARHPAAPARGAAVLSVANVASRGDASALTSR